MNTLSEFPKYTYSNRRRRTYGTLGIFKKEKCPTPERLIYDENEAMTAFAEIKKFQANELCTQVFSYMTAKELEDWILEYGSNKYLGDSLYLYDATRALQRVTQKSSARMEM